MDLDRQQMMMPWFDQEDFRSLLNWPQRLWSQMMRDVPSVEVADAGDALLVRVELPGIDPDEVDVDVAPSHVVIRGELRRETDESEHGVYHSERRYGRFQRTIPLPEEVDSDGASADFRNGLLEIRLPRAGHGRRRLRIQQRETH